LVVVLVLVSLVTSQASLASASVVLPAASPSTSHHSVPCHMAMQDGAATTHGGKPDTAPCPMMTDGFCLAMCAAALPSAPNAAMPIEYVSAHLPVFDTRVLTAHVVSPPQRPPKTL
jgi:hypothetical protein